MVTREQLSSPNRQKGGSDGSGISPPSHVDPTLHESGHLGVCFCLTAFFPMCHMFLFLHIVSLCCIMVMLFATMSDSLRPHGL